MFFSYLGVVLCAALAVLVPSLPGFLSGLLALPAAFWLMFTLACVADARPFTTAGPSQSVAVYASICFAFAALLVWGLPAAVLIQTAAVIVSSLRMHHTLWRAIFNSAQYTISLAVAHAILTSGAHVPLSEGAPAGWRDAILLLAAATVWFATSHLLVSTAVWLRFGGTLWQAAKPGIAFEALSALSLLLLGSFLVVAVHHSGWLIPLIGAPLYAMYRTARLTQEHERLSLIDPLTLLPNRKALFGTVEEAIAALREQPRTGPARRLALIVLDLDRFKQVNDALGHAVGDRLLIEVGRRLARDVPVGAFVARLGGDEFAVLSPRISSVEDAYTLAGVVAAALADPVELDGMPLDVASSIGIALYPEHGDDFAALLRHADVAMYDAKTQGDSVAVYEPESDHNSPARLGLLGDLRRSLETPGFGEVNLYYQPQVDMASGEVVGVEALLRWRHPVRGLVAPEELIKVAEHSGVMRLLTYRVIDEVIAQLARWADGGTSLRAAINVSVRDLHTTDLVDHLAERLSEFGISADQVQLEITEGALMADPRRVMATLQRLDRLGVALSLDDFGTGYSSMQHLRKLPLSEVKIDKSFVLGMSTDEDDASIVRSIIELAGALGLRVVAEGVEDERTWRWLAARGCHVAQGWFYARPMPADELPQWLAKYKPPMLLRVVPPAPEAAS